MIPYTKHEIIDDDIRAVASVLCSDHLTQGPEVARFEQSVADYCGAEHCVATNSGTSGLHLACLALGLGPGDQLWTSPITFVASANCGLYCGATVDFVDIDPVTYNLCPEALELKLQQAEKQGCLPKIVVPVHFCGQSCDMQAIYRLGQKYGFKIIEDACHALGGLYKKRVIGGCKYSDITVFSFHPAKLVTSGEGGMVLTNNADAASRVKLARTHGITREVSNMSHTSDGPWYYQQIGLGFNYRMSDIHAALGISQLKRLDYYVSRRHKLVKNYNNSFVGLAIRLPSQHTDTYSAFHLYVIRVDGHKSKLTRKEMYDSLRQSGIGVAVHYIPVHLQPYYRKHGFSSGDYPESENYYHQALTLPLYPTLSETEQEQVITTVRKVLSE